MEAADLERHRSRLTLAEEPDGVQTVLEVRTALTGEAPPDVHGLLAHDHEHEGGAGGAGESEGAKHEDAGHEGDEDAQAHEGDHDHAGQEHGEHEHGEHEHGEHSDKELDVVLVGLVGGVPNPFAETQPDFPFAKRQAMFFVADPEAVAELEEHGHQHAPGEECAFCLANAADGVQLIAAVQLIDEKGKVLPVDARELFDLADKETVVVAGKAKLVAGDILTVQATGLYVRR
jgi:hypothetical protein